MDCPFLKYEDGAWLDYTFKCKANGQKIGDQDNRKLIENVCRKDFFSCPYYKKMRG